MPGPDIFVARDTGNNEALRSDTAPSNGSVHRLPRASEVPSLSYQAGRPTSSNSETPLRHKRLPENNDADHPQYATYPSGNIESTVSNADKIAKGWVPWPLRLWFWIPLVVFMVLLAVGLEIALFSCKKTDGWVTSSRTENNLTQSKYLQYAYTTPPVILSMVIVALWAWTDIEIRRMQPYVDMVRGASAEKSLLLDYTRANKFIGWITAFWNQHYMVAVIALIALLTLLLNPLGADIFIIKDTWWGPPPISVMNMAAIGLNQGPEYQDLTVFLSAAGYASASVLYNYSDPSFIHGVYTIGPFSMPTIVGNNATVTANTTAVKTSTNCHYMDTVQTPDANGSFTQSATYNGCIYNYTVNRTTSHLFGTNVMPDCNNTGAPEYFRPVVLWFFSYDMESPKGSATYCAPSISLWEVSATVDIATKNLTAVQEIRPFDSTSPFSSLSANVTGAPLNGYAFNGIEFNLTNPDQFALSRSNAIQLQLPASIFQAASKGDGGLPTAFQNNETFTRFAEEVYGIYLKLVATTLYFLPIDEPILVEAQSFSQRLWMSEVAVHMEACILLMAAFVGTIVQLFHRASRRDLKFDHVPGTIASAIYIGGDKLNELLHSPQHQGGFAEALQNKRFRINRQTRRILMNDEEGYEDTLSPDARHSTK